MVYEVIGDMIDVIRDTMDYAMAGDMVDDNHVDGAVILIRRRP